MLSLYNASPTPESRSSDDYQNDSVGAGMSLMTKVWNDDESLER